MNVESSINIPKQNINNIFKLRDSAFEFANKVDDEKFHSDILELIFSITINTPYERIIMKGIQSIIPKKWDDIKDAVKGLIKIYDDAVEDDSVGDDSDDDSSSSQSEAESESDDSSSSESESESSSESESEPDAPKMTALVLPKDKHRVFGPIAGSPVGLRKEQSDAISKVSGHSGPIADSSIDLKDKTLKQEQIDAISKVFGRPDPEKFLANIWGNYTIKYIHDILKKYPEDYDNEYAKFVLGLYIPYTESCMFDDFDASRIIFAMLFELPHDVIMRQAVMLGKESIYEDRDIMDIAIRHLNVYGTDKYDRRELLKDMYEYIMKTSNDYEPVLRNYILKEVDYDYLINNVQLKGDTAIICSLLSKGAKK
jgi:hypothetical protein